MDDVSLLAQNTHLESLSTNIRARPIPWDGYQRAGLVSDHEVKSIKAVSSQQRQQDVFSKEGKQYAELVMGLLGKAKRADILQYVLVLAGDFIVEVKGWSMDLFMLRGENGDLPYGPIVKQLSSEDEAIRLLAARFLTSLLSLDPNPPREVVESYLTFSTTHLLSSPSPALQDFCLASYTALLRHSPSRPTFWSNTAVMSGTIDILKKNEGGLQVQYWGLVCLWLLSFEEDVARGLNKKYDVVPLLADIARTAIKEKIVRMVLAVFRNLVKLAPSQTLPAMLVARLLPLTTFLSQKKWSDPEIADDLTFLKEQLESNFAELTTFDEYASEIESGHLSWTPPHKSTQFWKQNARRIYEENNGALLRTLARTLQIATEPVVVGVACNDVKWFLREMPEGRKMLQELGTKQRVMELMQHPDAEVRFEALGATQVFMSHSWRDI
ncbi:H(+)-transporting V1 sector ATPase subunit H [Saitoella coloradoensis]